MRFLRKVGQRGIMTLPVELREAMQIADGDIVEFEVVAVVRRQGTQPTQAPAALPKETAA